MFVCWTRNYSLASEWIVDLCVQPTSFTKWFVQLTVTVVSIFRFDTEGKQAACLSVCQRGSLTLWVWTLWQISSTAVVASPLESAAAGWLGCWSTQSDTVRFAEKVKLGRRTQNQPPLSALRTRHSYSAMLLKPSLFKGPPPLNDKQSRATHLLGVKAARSYTLMSVEKASRGVAHVKPITPPSSTAKLPQHFAASFGYQANDTAGPPRSIPRSDSTAAISPRRSPRARQERFANLYEACSDFDDQEEYHPNSNGSSPSKKRATKSAEAGSDNDQVSQHQNCAKKPKSRKRIRRTRDDPNSATGSIYAHLKWLPDLFAEYNDIMFCGINPGVKSSSSGHHFAHRSNHFYPSLHLAGITQHRMQPEQDVEFPYLKPYSLGLTNLAGRPTAEGNELLPSELVDGVPVLLEKIRRWKPKTVCFVGKGISEAFIKGLKQAGAIQQPPSAKKRRSSQKTHSGAAATIEFDSKVKLEDTEPSLQEAFLAAPVDDEQAVPASLPLTLPADVLCAYAVPTQENGHAKTYKGTSPQKAKKQLYTKGNSKDDTGYGILPICVPHSSSKGACLSLDQVTLFFVTPSSSARVTTHFVDDKARILKSLRRLVQYLRDTEPAAVLSANGSLGRDQACGSHANSAVKLETESSVANRAYVLLPALGPTSTIDLEVVDLSRFKMATTDTQT